MKERMTQKTSIIFKKDLKNENFVMLLFLYLKYLDITSFITHFIFPPTGIHRTIKIVFLWLKKLGLQYYLDKLPNFWGG